MNIPANEWPFFLAMGWMAVCGAVAAIVYNVGQSRLAGSYTLAMKNYTSDEIKELLNEEFWPQVNVWLDRGDGIAVYRSAELGPSAGHCKFTSYGSEHAQLESAQPPEQMPDIGGQINWRYRLAGVYRGAALETVCKTCGGAGEVVKDKPTRSGEHDSDTVLCPECGPGGPDYDDSED